MTTTQTTATSRFQDYGYRAWEDVRVGDYVQHPMTAGQTQPVMVRVVHLERIPSEMTATGTADYVRATFEWDDGHQQRHAVKHHLHTTVYYRIR